tara:strand:+ start:7307 stop:7465 length:159 start_codon:yes stop_codon:yes gene_type:complete
MMQTFEQRQAAQRKTVQFAGLLSPAIFAQFGLEAASGTGALNAAKFRSQARS